MAFLEEHGHPESIIKWAALENPRLACLEWDKSQRKHARTGYEYCAQQDKIGHFKYQPSDSITERVVMAANGVGTQRFVRWLSGMQLNPTEATKQIEDAVLDSLSGLPAVTAGCMIEGGDCALTGVLDDLFTQGIATRLGNINQDDALEIANQIKSELVHSLDDMVLYADGVLLTVIGSHLHIRLCEQPSLETILKDHENWESRPVAL
jgi:hypothetical protein